MRRRDLATSTKSGESYVYVYVIVAYEVPGIYVFLFFGMQEQRGQRGGVYTAPTGAATEAAEVQSATVYRRLLWYIKYCNRPHTAAL